MTKASALEIACALEREGKFKESYEAFCKAADETADSVEKASILLSAVSDLLAMQNINLAKRQLEAIKVLFTGSDTRQAPDQHQRVRVSAGIELQEALVAVAEDRQREALAAFDAWIKKYKHHLQAPYFKDIRDSLYAERAFVLADLGSFADALTVLQGLETTHAENPAVIFYLGYCYFSCENYAPARGRLEKAITLGLTGNFQFRAHWALGIVLCDVGDYMAAKNMLERARGIAKPSDIVNGRVFEWLEYCCKQLGLKDEAVNYALLAKPRQ